MLALFSDILQEDKILREQLTAPRKGILSIFS